MARRRLLVALAAVVLFAVVVSVAAALLLVDAFGTARWTRLPLALADPQAVLPRDADGRTNLLLLGLGQDVEPPLTDTILVASIDVAARRAALISVPRDLAYPFPDGSRRINEAYSIGGEKGGEYARRVVGDVLGLDIQRLAVVAIEGLSAIVDDLGGVPVEVDHAFSDEVVENSSFDAGWQWLSGERALAFARARHAGAFEGSDFARIRRQQKLLLAIEQRLLSPSTLLDPARLKHLFHDVVADVKTDVRAEDVIALARLAPRLGGSTVQRVSLAEEGLVVEMRGSEGAYLLEPSGGDFAATRRRVRALLGISPAAETRRDADLAVVARADWDPDPPRYVGPAQEIRRIVIHHDGVDFPPGTPGVAKLRALRASALRRHGWHDFPYHYAVDLDGLIYAGRDEAWKGDTASAYDTSDTLQIALLGNHRTEPPTPAQLRSLVALVRRKLAEHALGDGDVYLHGDVARTGCPGVATRTALAGLWTRPAGATPFPIQPPPVLE